MRSTRILAGAEPIRNTATEGYVSQQCCWFSRTIALSMVAAGTELMPMRHSRRGR